MSSGKSIRDQKEEARRLKRRKMREAAGGTRRKKSLTAVVMLSLVAAAAGTALAVLAFRIALSIGIEIDPDLQNLVVMLGFIIIFLIALLIFMKRHMAYDLLGGGHMDGDYKAPSDKWGGAMEAHKPRYEKVFDDTLTRKVAEPTSLDDQNTFTETPELTPPPPDLEEDAGQGPGAGPGQGPKASVGAGPGGPDAEETGGEDKAAANDKPVSDETMAMVLNDLKVVIVAVSEVLNNRGKKIDGFAKFGLNLYFAGVCAHLTKHFNLSASEGLGLLTRLMELTGADSQAARTFSDSVNGYGEYRQYRNMIDAGDAFMASHFADDGEPLPDLGAVIDAWIEAGDTTSLPATHVFMFTDIIDTDSLAEDIGGDAMKEVIETHNDTVREALEKFQGREVKHTGEGIMALFDDARAAIDAAVQMQQDINLFSRQTPRLAFDIRIGLHVGEAVKENDDYFGKAVKTAALVCKEAGGEEIWVSEEVWKACPYYADDLRYGGEFKLDGIDDEKMLYTMLWEPLTDPNKNGKVGYGEIGTN